MWLSDPVGFGRGLGIGMVISGVLVMLAAFMPDVHAAKPLPSPSVQRWEYTLQYGLAPEQANALGAQGWEMAAPDGHYSGRFWFKRPRK